MGGGGEADLPAGFGFEAAFSGEALGQFQCVCRGEEARLIGNCGEIPRRQVEAAQGGGPEMSQGPESLGQH